MKLKNITIKVTIIYLLFSGCKSFKPHPALPLILNQKEGYSNTLKRETINQFINKNIINRKKQIEEIKYVYNNNYDSIISSYTKPINIKPLYNHYFSRKNTIGKERIEIENGYPKGEYQVFVMKNDRFFILKTINYINKNLSGDLIINSLDSIVLYKTTFQKGNGYWKDYYYEKGVLKEEGKVKNNYKDGLWNYYNRSGTIDSTKTYTLKDAVDVRFPYCFFNKNEPCF